MAILRLLGYWNQENQNCALIEDAWDLIEGNKKGEISILAAKYFLLIIEGYFKGSDLNSDIQIESSDKQSLTP